MFEAQLKKLEALEPLLNKTRNSALEVRARFLYERIIHPDSYLVFLGETSSGKSSVINGLMGADILPMRANPSTAAITEVELSAQANSEEYYAINKNATIERIDKNKFLELSEHPINNLERLKVTRRVKNKRLDNLKIFDTPGYDSIFKEHEEVLKDFLPNSDVIVYTVNYKIGIQDADYIFLSTIRELIRPDVKIFLLINRCPLDVDNTSPKIRNISKNVADILTIDPVVFTLTNKMPEEGEAHPLPYSEELWNAIADQLAKPSRVQSLAAAFDHYIRELYDACLKQIEASYLAAKMDDEEFQSIKSLQEESATRIRQAIPEFVVPTFERIRRKLPQQIADVKRRVQPLLDREIDSSSRSSMEDMVSFTNAHLLPHTIKEETQEVQNYINVELDDLNKRVDDYLQKELIKFNNEITIVINTNFDKASQSILANILKNTGKSSLEGYFIAFGGAGGANAGIANATSHLLKQAGDIFGHTFSRATHNTAKHFLSKIGATSMKAVGAAVAVIVELLFIGYQLATWKSKLCKQIEKGLDKWEEETLPIIVKDLDKLRDENIGTITEIAEMTAHTFDGEKSGDIDKCHTEYTYAKNIGKELGFE
jgi:GTPase SAR1 family protein